MKIDLARVQDANLRDKVVLVRVDHNVLKNGEIRDPDRINRTIGTLYNIVERGGRLILMTHIGRPRDRKTHQIHAKPEEAIDLIVRYIQNRLYTNFAIPQITTDGGIPNIHTSINLLIKDLKKHRIGGIYLPNIRWFHGEEDSSKSDRFCQQLAGLADIYVNDAFASWQVHSSTYGVTKYLPSYAGYLMQYEIKNVERILQAKRPFVAVIGGFKFATKLKSLSGILEQVDYLILGGHIYNTYLAAKYGFEIKGVDDEQIAEARKFINKIGKYQDKIIEIPLIEEVDDLFGSYKAKEIDIRKLSKGAKLQNIYDVSPNFVKIQRIRDVILNAKTIFVNAVMGFSPYFLKGSMALYTLIDQNKDALKLYGGGDTNQEFKLNLPRMFRRASDDDKYYFFTGGGTLLKVLETGSIMGIEPVKALVESHKRIKDGEYR